jgi:NADPH:quinone reductase-like Zn-dependent oxidoreductase
VTVVRVRRSAVIDAPVATVWALLRDFNAHDRWHPAVASSRMEGSRPVDQVGGVRAFRLKDGAFLREKLIGLDDRARRLTYCILEAPLRLDGYVATLTATPVTDGDRTFVEWESRFDPPEGEAGRLMRLVAEEIYEAGLAALQRRFAGAGAGGAARPATAANRPAVAAPPALRPLTVAGPPHSAFETVRTEAAPPTVPVAPTVPAAGEPAHRWDDGEPARPWGTRPEREESDMDVFTVVRRAEIEATAVGGGRGVDDGPRALAVARSAEPLPGQDPRQGQGHGQRPGPTALPSSGRPVAGAIEAAAIVVSRHGGPEVLVPATVSVPPPGPGEVRLRQTAIGVNYIDVYCRTGYFDLLTPPAVPGMEAAGIVIDVGPGVTHLAPGDRVAYACPPVGAYATARTMAAALVLKLPASIDDETAAAVLLKGLTAEFLLHRVHAVRPGEVVVVHAAAGGVGLMLCQWASALGAAVIGTVSTDEKAVLARRAGCDLVVVHGREPFSEAVKRATGGRGADVIYDAIGRDSFLGSVAALAVRGHLVSFGQASGPVGAHDIGAFASKSATISRPNYGHYTADPVELRAMAARLFAVLAAGTVQPLIGARLPLAAAAEAHARLEARATVGSTVLTV